MDPVTQVPHLITANGKPVWKDNINPQNADLMYSERSATYEMGDAWVVIPTVNSETGEEYTPDVIEKHLKENGEYDISTGDKLRVFEDMEDANIYAQQRSDMLLDPDADAEDLYNIGLDDGRTWKSMGRDFKDHVEDTVYDVKSLFGMGSEDYYDDSYDVASEGFARGGLNLADGMKGRSEEDKEIAEEKEQADVSQGDTNEDGFLSPGEREIQIALQKNELVDEEDIPMKMSHGGMSMGCGCDGDCDGSCGVTGYDEVSGNPIPIGSTAENVRDDIDAKLSTDEYVLPANVVKWHGLKYIMDLQAEAEMGLMSMHMSGLIQHDQEEPSGEEPEDAPVSDESDTGQEKTKKKSKTQEEGRVDCPECDGSGCEHCGGKGYHDANMEVATVKVEDHLKDEEDKEISPKSKPLPSFIQKRKVVYAI